MAHAHCMVYYERIVITKVLYTIVLVVCACSYVMLCCRVQPPTLGPATFRPQGWGRGGAGGGTAVQDTVKSEKDSKRPSR